MTDYERVRSQCLQRGELWEDPDFPAVQTSVFYHQTPPFHFVWKRPKDIYTSPCFVRENCDTFDVVPGKLGDVWLVSCLGVLCLNKGLFYRVVSADQRLDSGYTGVFRFRLWRCGQWLEVLVDDRLPTVNGKLAFLQSTHTGQLWPALLEKAYAKLHGSYEALKYGSMLDGLADLTGGITESLPVTDAAAIAALLRTSSIVTAYFLKSVLEIKLKGLELGMNYKICNIEKVNSADGPIFLVRLKRPLAPGESPFFLLLESPVWKSIPSYERDRLSTTTSGFWMLFSDFQRAFKRLEIVHLDAENSRAEPSLQEKQKWQMKMHEGGWRRGVSAGGCRNNVDFFHTNPQLQIILNESDTVIISLYQHSIMEPKVIGFSIYKLTALQTETAPPAFFRKHKSSINSQYTNSRQVSHRCQLESGAYLVIPTTFEPREEASFSLRVFSTKPLKMSVLDYAPKMLKPALIKAPPEVETSAYEPVFLQLADEHKTIDAFELQELLDVCLPNDYIKSCASIDTCRQIVLSLDKNSTGRISLSDFNDLVHSLKSWQLVFKNHAVEKMGVLRAERLRDALMEVGFVVHERALALLVLRYMRKDGMLRFGDFVSAVMHLHRAFNAFYSNGTPHAEAIRGLTLSESTVIFVKYNSTSVLHIWLKWALMC